MKKLPLLGSIIAFLYFIVLFLGNFREDPRLFLFLYGALFLIYLLAIHHLKEKPTIKQIIFFSILFHAILLPATPSLSDDIYRYIWDGQVHNAGINPYEFPPNSPQLDHIPSPHRDRVNFPDIPTSYPPAAQLLFLLLSSISPTILFFKLIFILFAILTALPIIKILKHYNKPIHNVLIYLWNPLLIIETAHSGHFDSVGIFLTLISLNFLLHSKKIKASTSIALATLTKFFTLPILPLFFKKTKNKIHTLLPLLLIPLAHLPYLTPSLFTGITNYGKHWSFNSPIFFYLDKLLQLTALHSGLTSRYILAAIFFLLVALILWKIKNLITAALLLTFSFLILTPTIHPWYILWILPYLAIKRLDGPFYLTFAAPISYFALIQLTHTGSWQVPGWIYIIEFLPVFILLYLQRGKINVA